MKKATLLIKEIENNLYYKRFKDIYVDDKIINKQKDRYINSIKKFIELYGDKEIEIYSTPGRSEVCGNHTDHQHGEVLATAINLDIIAVVTKDEKEIKILSDNIDIPSINVMNLDKKNTEIGTSIALVRGVVARLNELKYNIGGFKAYFTSNVFQGSGLSSSAAFEVLIGTIISGLYNDMDIDPVTIAKIGQYSENYYFAKPCGLMDQCACSVGGLISIDFKDNNNPKVSKVKVDFSKFRYSLCIVDVHSSHADLIHEYSDILKEMQKVARYFNKEYLIEIGESEFFNAIPNMKNCITDRAILRTIHFIEENKRVRKAIQQLENEDFEEFKKVIKTSGDSSYKYLQNIYSENHIDTQAISIALALSEKILGQDGISRVHGGGFAGTIQVFVKDEFVEKYKKEIEKYFGINSCYILKVRKYGGIKVM